ncbi:MAG: nucleotidyltransferase domain-containing protein, partial [Ignavibacteriae bacterium]|nr:nucleotidyltransferase domain-containing protein [Ignavibacteriota bacterium]
MHKEFVETVIEKIKQDENVLGLAIGGSWITNDIDEFSDIDFVLVTKNKIAPDKEKMIKFTEQFGNLLNA